MQVALSESAPRGASGTRAPRGPAGDFAWLLAGFLALALWDASGLDLPISRWFGGAAGFPWRDHWLFAGVLHANAKWFAVVVCAALLVNVWRPLPFARATSRSVRVWWLAATLGSLALIPALKHISSTSCPWSLAEFGGTARYVSHWAFGQVDGGPGRCFPAGHASAAFCFLAGYFALRDSAPIAARRWLLATIAAGAFLGVVQVVRGAHFVSHALWTGWWCWALTIVTYHAFRRATRPHVPNAPCA